jgi:WD40 repeat protein/serine/threonine protein kinase
MTQPVDAVVPATGTDPILDELIDAFAARLQAGERLEPEAYAREHPERAEALRRILPAMLVLADLGQAGALRAEADEVQPAGPLGDYQIVREVGRGGMGVVYEAVQISLGRRVALKVLPFAAALDTKQLQRFKNEAQAAAHLQHTHIVPVYAVGCERGVHFYAMQFIDGHTLAAIIRELRKLSGQEAAESSAEASSLAGELVSGRWAPSKPTPTREPPTGPYTPPAEPPTPVPSPLTATPPVAALSTERSARSSAFFRTVARLGVQAAEALEHAHQLGVIHRDIKPANLLVDAMGRLWVTDFGLARLGNDAGLTMTGDLLGTIRYMSPEQALAKRVAVDARTDVYSLGVTLYELLTLEPAYNGKNREEVLRQIAFEEPQAPRRLNRAVPAELETIVLKAMSKHPDERYATAQEFAQDLERFLEDKPIKARRPSLLHQARKWARRHKTVVRAAGVVLILAVAALAVSTALVWRADQELRRNLYYHLIAGAEREWTANNLGRMQQLLDECPEKLRGWEWHYLRRLRFKTLSPLRHEGAVFCAVFSPDGKRIASSGGEGMIRLWDAATGQLLRKIPAHDDVVHSIAYSLDEQYIASGCKDGTVKLWDADTGRALRTFTGHVEVHSVAFSPDGRHLASGGGTDAGESGEVNIWEVATGKKALSLSSPPPKVWCVRFSPDGGRLAAGGGGPEIGGGVAKIWDIRTGQETITFRLPPRGIRGMAFSPDGKRLAAVAGTVTIEPNQEVKVWDTQTGREVHSLRGHVGGLQTVAFSPDGRRLASGGLDQTIKLWDTATGREVLTLRGHLYNILSVAFSPDGNRLVSASPDKTVRVWDASPMESATGEEFMTFRGHGGPVTSVAFHPADGVCVASGSADATVKLWDPWSGRELHSLVHANPIWALAFSPDGRRLVAGGGQKLTVWDVTTAKELFPPAQTADMVLSVAFNADGKWIASSTFRPMIQLFDAATGRETRTPLRVHNFAIHAVAFSPRDGHLLASADVDSNVDLWDAQRGQALRVLEPRHTAGGACVAFSLDGQLLASGSWDRTIRVWDTGTWKLVYDLHDPTGAVQSLAFSPEGRPQAQRLAWGSTDGLVKIWDEASREVQTLRGHTGWVLGVAFSPDGKQLASASADGTVKIWNVPPLAKPSP